MHACGPPQEEAAADRPHLEVADIVRAHGEAYLGRHPASAAQRKVLRDVISCRTAALGGHLDFCASCGFSRPVYNSCRNRHCPKCQALSQARWIAERQARILPTHYFHVVFTLPAELRPLAFRNREKVFDLLFACASQTLLALGRDQRRLGALIGITAVLHTWSRDLGFHPHLHCIVTGGGLSLDSQRWIPGRKGYLFPVRVLGKLFRGKMLDALRRAYENDELALDGDAAPLADKTAFDACIDALYRKNWIVYAKPPFGGAEQVVAYLGRYTHRVGISNHRLVRMDERGVCFRTRGDKSITLPHHEFLRRFLLHVLPRRFVKIRHFGLMAPSHATTSLEIARERITESLHPAQPELSSDDLDGHDIAAPRDWRDLFSALTGINPSACPRCGANMTAEPLLAVTLSPPPPDTS